MRAQNGAGTLSGQVNDPTGAVVPNATVTATSAAGQARTVQSNAQGNFSFRLPAGSYRVDATASGFAPFQQGAVQVAAGQSAKLNIPLSVASAQAQVEVQAQPVQVSVAPTENANDDTTGS